jgi:hypothetical protein
MSARRPRRGRSPAPALAVGLVIVVVLAAALVVRATTTQPGSTPGTATAGAASTQPHAGGPRLTTPVPATALVATGAPQHFGEAVGASSGALQVAVATAWLPTMLVVQTWQRANGGSWSAARDLLPAGFHRGYDPSIARLSNGTILVTSGVDLNLRPLCLDAGSVAIQRMTASGTSAPVLVDDERGTVNFDDRPTVAAGAGSEVWVGWSQGTRPSSCALIGGGDQVHLAVSTDGGRTFSQRLALTGPGANYGVQIAPTGPGTAYVAWTQTLPAGTFRILVAQVINGHLVRAPTVAGTGTPLPAQLHGATFPSFTVPTLTLINGRPALAWAAWTGGRAVLQLALPAASGPGWATRTIVPAPGTDDLLPALGGASGSSATLLYAVHRRSDDAVSYQLRRVAIGTGVSLAPARTVLAGAPGPGFHELGESLQISDSARTSTTALVAGGADFSRLWTATWTP